MAPIVEKYIIDNLDEMASEELAKLYCTVHNRIGDLLTKEFKIKIENLIDELFPKA